MSSSTELARLTVLIPARDEQSCIGSTVRHLHVELEMNAIDHEIIVVDDGSTDGTWQVLMDVARQVPTLRAMRKTAPHGFGRAIAFGLDAMAGDAVVIMMADESDDCRDVVRYWHVLQEGYDCVFGSRFVRRGGVVDYPFLKLVLNRIVNRCIQALFHIGLNDTTNAFKGYRRTAIAACRPLIAPHFNITVGLPLKAIARGLTWKVIPITWRNRRSGMSKLQLREMGSRYLFIVAYVWLEKYFSRGDYRPEGLKSPSAGSVGPAKIQDARIAELPRVEPGR